MRDKSDLIGGLGTAASLYAVLPAVPGVRTLLPNLLHLGQKVVCGPYKGLPLAFFSRSHSRGVDPDAPGSGHDHHQSTQRPLILLPFHRRIRKRGP